jgi:tetratricopeptide (TPR) repeat protein
MAMRIVLLTAFMIFLSLPAFAQSDAIFDARGNKPMSLDEYENVPKGLLLTKDERFAQDEKERIEKEKLNPVKEIPATGEASSTETPVENTVESTPASSLMPYEEILALYRRGDFATAINGLKPLAEGGHHGAEELLGVMYRLGQGVEKNPQEAMVYLQRAAEQSRPLAQHHLGIMFYQGDGMEAEPTKAMMWLNLAVIYYPEGAEKEQAKSDRQNVSLRMTRREKDNAYVMTREWLAERGEAHLLEAPQD